MDTSNTTAARKAGRPRKDRRTASLRLDAEAVRWARIAATYAGLSVVDYLSGIVLERARSDAERSHSESPRPRPRSRKGGA